MQPVTVASEGLTLQQQSALPKCLQYLDHHSGFLTSFLSWSYTEMSAGWTASLWDKTFAVDTTNCKENNSHQYSAVLFGFPLLDRPQNYQSLHHFVLTDKSNGVKKAHLCTCFYCIYRIWNKPEEKVNFSTDIHVKWQFLISRSSRVSEQSWKSLRVIHYTQQVFWCCALGKCM